MGKYQINHFTECDCSSCHVVSADILRPGEDDLDCGCECAGPIYDEKTCSRCPWNFGCNVVDQPELYPNTIPE